MKVGKKKVEISFYYPDFFQIFNFIINILNEI